MGQTDPEDEWGRIFSSVSSRLWQGLLVCYENLALPRTNDALEQFF